MNSGSYVISAAKGGGVYRHIRISSSATLLDLHEAITAAYEINGAGRPSFTPQKSAKGKQKVRYSLNNTKNTVAMREVKLSDTDFAGKSGMLYALSDSHLTLSCRTLRALDEPTPEPQVVRASGSSYRYEQSLANIIKILANNGLPRENLHVMEEIADLTKESRNKLLEYYLAASNLYGLVPLRTVHEMYCKNQPPVSLYTFTMFGIVVSGRDKCRFSILDKNGWALDKRNYKEHSAEYVAEYTVTEGDAFHDVRAMQEGKPYYLPPEGEFLRYADINYVERNEQYLHMKTHLQSLGLDPEEADECIMDILEVIKFSDFDTQEIFDIIAGYDVQFKNLKAVRQMANLLMILNNNTRSHLNCGHTPEELGTLRRSVPGMTSQKVFIPSSTNQLQHENNFQSKGKAPVVGNLISFPPLQQTVQKAGRNDPCPCGSGKKFKYCCGRPRQ